ncbi:hypothetical protein FCV25MIE_33881 [Fagus crenata]
MAPPSLHGPPALHRPATSTKPKTAQTLSQQPSLTLILPTSTPTLDLFFKSTKDHLDPTYMNQYLEPAWNHDPLTTFKLIFKLALVNKECFIASLLWLNQHHPKTLALNLQGFSRLGYLNFVSEILYHIMKEKFNTENLRYSWSRQNKNKKKEDIITCSKRAVKLYKSNLDYRYLYNRVADLFAKLLKSDIEYLKLGEIEKISMASRWCPLDTLHDKWTLLCEGIARLIFPRDSDPDYKDIEEAHYVYLVRDRLSEEVLVPLRKALRSAKKWKLVPQKPAPSDTMKKLYVKTFDDESEKYFSKVYEEKYNVYLEIATNWEKESGVLLPHQIVANLNNGSGREVVECEWQRLVRHLEKKGSLKNCLAICDTSKMIGTTQIDVCVSMGLLISELSDEPWKGKVITCSQNPKLCRIEGDNLQSKIEFMKGQECDGNIDCHKVFDLILEVAVAEKLSQDRMVKTVFVFSEMGFEQAGYKALPEIVFWNFRDPASSLVARKREGKAMVGGVLECSLSALLRGKVVLTLEDLVKSVPKPEELMESAISGEDYNNLIVFD